MRKLIIAGLVGTAAFGIVVTAALSTSSSAIKTASGEEKKPAKPCYEPVVPIDILMDMVSDSFDEALEQLKAKKFSKVRKASYALAEFMNVAQHHSSEEVDKKKMAEWKKISLEIRGEMLTAAAAAKKKDSAAVKKILNRVEDTCEKCHDLRE
jgi:cytochrome c556